MTIVLPRIAIFDSATLGKVSHDFWQRDLKAQAKARSFLAWLKENGIYIGITTTHLCELLGHGDQKIALERLILLQAVPLVAWVRPYRENWFPGSCIDVVVREIDFTLRSPGMCWPTLVEQVRPGVWETGSGDEIFFPNDRLWNLVRTAAKRRVSREVYVASILKSDPGRVGEIRLGEIRTWAERSKSERAAYWKPFAEDMQQQLQRHGDKRLGARCRSAAQNFASKMYNLVESLLAQGGDWERLLLEAFGIPPHRVNPRMTVNDLGALAAYCEQLKTFGKILRPPRKLTIDQVPPDALPSYTLSHQLATIQRSADRVSGSDLGDQHIASLLLYADFVEVDKRTCEFLRRVRRGNPNLAPLLGRFERVGDYSRIPDLAI